MLYFFPDSRDQIDPTFDFAHETHSDRRVQQRTDQYPHEALRSAPYDGVLLSKTVVDGYGDSHTKYSLAQRQRLLRNGVRAFFRLDQVRDGRRLYTMGDCGAYSFVNEPQPPIRVQDLIDYYTVCGFDYGVALDHVIPGYRGQLDGLPDDDERIPAEWRRRRTLSLQLAESFLNVYTQRGCTFTPIGVAQGWSPSSYARSVTALQTLGYRYIGVGGLSAIQSSDIVACLECINRIRHAETRLHLFGLTRPGMVAAFQGLGVWSFDSTSPLRRAFKDDIDNYYTPHRTYTAIRVPQIQMHAGLKQRLRSGVADLGEARRLEQACLTTLTAYDHRRASLEKTLQALCAYTAYLGELLDRADAYGALLSDRPWTRCPCGLCADIGIHIVIFRGAERNKRRGFHNLFVFSERMRSGATTQENDHEHG